MREPLTATPSSGESPSLSTGHAVQAHSVFIASTAGAGTSAAPEEGFLRLEIKVMTFQAVA